MERLIAIVGVILTLAAAPAHAAPLDDNARQDLAMRLAASATDARDDRADDALRKCNEARSYAARYDQDALTQGRIEICFGLAAIFRKDRNAACAAYGRALPLLTGAEPSDAMLDLDQAKRSHRELGC
jgi:hypothetical protein